MHRGVQKFLPFRCPGIAGTEGVAEIAPSLELAVVAAQQAGSPALAAARPARESARRLNVRESSKAGHETSERSALPYAAKSVGSISGLGLPLRVLADQIEGTATRADLAILLREPGVTAEKNPMARRVHDER